MVRTLAAALATSTCIVALATPAAAQTREYNIPAGPLKEALDAYVRLSGQQIVYRADEIRYARSSGVHGSLSSQAALAALLAGTGFTTRIDGKLIAIVRVPGNGNSATEAAPPSEDIASGYRAEQIVVTGTRIRGGSTASPVIAIGHQQIREEGFTDLGEVVRSIPQNFEGGQNPGVAVGASQGSPSNQNITGGSGINLRGLGPDATLTLLNGRRMAYGGFAQAIDISTIPLEAVERIEIVPDGASAIYGSDAVGGVANVILKRDFEGLTVGARYGGATEGGLTTHEYTASLGTTWATGGLIATGMKSFNDPVYSDQRDYTQSMYRPSTLWQGSDLLSGLVSLHQSLGGAAELHIDALRSRRDITTSQAYASAYYPRDTEANITLASASLEIWLSDEWTLTFSGSFGKDKNSQVQSSVNLSDGTVAATNNYEYLNKSLNSEVGLEGPLFMLPGGSAKLAAGAGYRYNDFKYLIGGVNNANGKESSRYIYAELNLPLIGPRQDIAGIERLALTGAIRAEHGDYGTVTTPKLGIVYSPIEYISLKGSWGRSFKAPTLLQRYFSNLAIYYPAATLGGTGYPPDATVLWRAGGNTDLKPERASTWSASLEFHPQKVLSGLNVELTWFHIDYTARVLQPITTNDVLGNSIYAAFVDYDPTEAAKAAALTNISNFYNYVGTPYDASNVVAIADGRYVNAARQQIRGIDLSGSYRADLGAGQLTLRGSASWLHSTQALTAAQQPYDLAGTLYYPAKFRSRIGAVYQQAGFTASLFGNYTSGVINTADETKGASFTTFDATLSYNTGAGDRLWSNVILALSARNLLDSAPPLYEATSLTYAPYDSTNYSAVGRFLSISVSKHW